MSWQMVDTRRLTERLLRDLFDNELAAVRIPRFISRKRCALAAESIGQREFSVFQNVPKIGISRTEYWHLEDGEDRYLADVAEADERRREILRESGDFFPEILASVQGAWPRKVGLLTQESSGRPYFAGILRALEGNLLHVDWDPHDAPRWTCGKISAQLGLNVYLQLSDRGGELTMFRKFWRESAEIHRIVESSYGYHESVVSNCERVRIRPRPGDLIFINTRNFHRVEATEGRGKRLTMSSLLGLMKPSEELVFWC